MYKISLGLHCRKGAHYFPNWQACGKQKKKETKEKRKSALCLRHVAAEQISLCNKLLSAY